MTAIMLADHGRTVQVEELRQRVSGLNLESGLRCVTSLSSRYSRGDLAESESLANSFSLPVLGKAIVLWANPEGGDLIDSNEVEWLLRAVNSLPWHSRLAAEIDSDDSVLSMIIRQGFQRYYYDDPLDSRIARTWMMFHELAATEKTDVSDPSAELETLLGVSAEDMWVVGFMLWAFSVGETAKDHRKWVISPSQFVQEGPNQQAMKELLERVFQTIVATPAQIRQRYSASGSKYRSNTDREGHWLSEFNILRDFPAIKRDDGTICIPIPTFALTRALDGFFFDLLEEFAERKRRSGEGGNAYDNAMCRTLGTLFERYTGKQLELLPHVEGELLPEFKYGTKKDCRDSTDWILVRDGRLPVLFECKARESTLDVQRYADREQLRGEIKKAIGKAGKQLARMIEAIDADTVGLEALPKDSQFVCVIVLQAPLPFHMIRDIRQDIESVITEMEPAWASLRNRIHFVPMSIRELETAVATELSFGVPIETQLIDYAAYRENVNRLDGYDEQRMPIFSRHLEEFLQDKYGGGTRISNPLCDQKWNEFCDFAQQRIFSESISVADEELNRELAHALWVKRGEPLWDSEADWEEAKRMIAAGIADLPE